MVKEAITTHSMPIEEVVRLAACFGVGDGTVDGLVAKQLFGGFSGLTYRLDETNGAKRTFVLKQMNGYPATEVHDQAAVQGFLGAVGFTAACAAICHNGQDKRSASPYVVFGAERDENTGEPKPCVMLTHVPGVPADAAIESHGTDPIAVLRSIGQQLARMHIASASPTVRQPLAAAADTVDTGASSDASAALSEQYQQLRKYTANGCCELRAHVSGAMMEEIEGSEYTRSHPYASYYAARLPALKAALQAPELPEGVVHGDPFLDNILVDSTTGAVEGFIDFEDACVAPFLFDVACCLIGTCFGEGDQASILQKDRVKAFLSSYVAVRPLHKVERQFMQAFVSIALLCNCSWRFVNFHIRNRAAVAARDSYKDLQLRIDTVETPEAAAMIAEAMAVGED